MEKDLKVTSLEEIAEKTKAVYERDATNPGELVKLPKTGIVVRLRRADLEGEALTGGLPMSLVLAAQDVNEDVAEVRETTPEENAENAKALIFMRQTVVENCLEPRIGQDVAGRVCFMAEGRAIARVHKDDFMFMFGWISGQEGNDGIKKFRNRKERRASAAKSGGKTPRSRSVGVTEREPAPA